MDMKEHPKDSRNRIRVKVPLIRAQPGSAPIRLTNELIEEIFMQEDVEKLQRVFGKLCGFPQSESE